MVNGRVVIMQRDAEHRESLSTTLRTVRAESLRQTNDIQRLQDKYTEATRKLALSEASEASLKTQLKTAEAAIHRLKDEAARQKTLVAQTRAACANEVRKRERQIEGLKKAVTEAGRARGMGRGGALVVSVTGSPLPPALSSSKLAGEDETEASFASGPVATANPDGLYDLRSETNAFLAELAKGLSEENEHLLGLVRGTMGRLKDMSGWEYNDIQNVTGVAEMASEIDAILEHLRTILTNPSFVPIEEVVVREDEINRLRHGWEKMESRWQEAVHLIDGWKRRMQVSGRPVNMEELKMGLRLSPVRVKNVEETNQGRAIGMDVGPLRLGLSPVAEHDVDEQQMCDGARNGLDGEPSPSGSLRLVPAPRTEEAGYADDGSDVSSIFEDDVEDDFDVDRLDIEEPNVEILEQSVLFESPPLPVPQELTPLRDNYASGNRGGALNYKKRPGDFSTIIEERTSDLKDEAPLPPPHAHLPAPQPSPTKKPSKPLIRPVEPEGNCAPGMSPAIDLTGSNSSLDSILLVQEPSEELAAAPRPKRSKPPKQQPQSAPLPVPPKQERQEREKRKPPVPKQAVPARKPVQSSSTKTGKKLPQPRQEQQAQKDTEKSSPTVIAAPAAPISSSSTRIVSAASAVSAMDTTTAAVDISSTSTSSNTTSKSNKLKPAVSPDRDAAMMPPPPLPPSKMDASAELNKSPKRGGVNSRLPLPRPGSSANLRGDATQQLNMNLLPPPQQSPLSMATIQAKLAASEREADAARVRAKLKAARLGKRVSLAPPAVAAAADGDDSRPSSALSAAGNNSSSSRSNLRRAENPSPNLADEEEDELAADSDTKPVSRAGSGAPTPQKRYPAATTSRTRHQPQQDGASELEDNENEMPMVGVQQRKVKREKRVVMNSGAKSSSSRRASRRRSTLNPWELETLIKGGVPEVISGVGEAIGEATF